MKRDHKFKFDDIVYYQEKPWVVVGIYCSLGYGFNTWLYQLAANLYGEFNPNYVGASKTDHRVVTDIKEHEIATVEQYKNFKQSLLTKTKERLEKELRVINENLSK